MMAELKPYPEYEASGLPWLKGLAPGWRILRGKGVFSAVDIRSQTGKEELLTVSVVNGVRPRSQQTVTMFMAKSYVGHKLCWPGDLVVNSLWAWMQGLGVAQHHGLISSAYSVYRPRRDFTDYANFFHYLLRSAVYKWELRTRSKGVWTSRLQLLDQAFMDMPIVLPPRKEQEAIVRFLDHANGRIERAIQAKKKLIALLNEQKQAIIHRAVTLGFDPNARVKPSGSQWFPELPEKWKALSLRRVINASIDGPHFSPRYYDSGIPFLSARNVKADRWSLEDAKFISEADYKEFCKRVRPEVGDVLYTKGGTTGVARAVDLTFRFQLWVHIAVLKLIRHRVTPEFLALCLNSPKCYEQSQLFTRGATNQDLGLGRMKEIELPVPPTLEEQTRIVEKLEMRLSSIKSVIARTEREIGLLREYRTRLISDVVTGKLDVREAASQLPATFEEIPVVVADADELEEEAVA